MNTVAEAVVGYEVKGLSFRAFVYGIAAHKVTDAFRVIGRRPTDGAKRRPSFPTRQLPVRRPQQRLLAAELAERLGHLLHVGAED